MVSLDIFHLGIHHSHLPLESPFVRRRHYVAFFVAESSILIHGR
jgi:hypothetical protein